jgi:hypothetical protein
LGTNRSAPLIPLNLADGNGERRMYHGVCSN